MTGKSNILEYSRPAHRLVILDAVPVISDGDDTFLLE